MSVVTIVEDARKSMYEFLRKYKFKKANAERAKAAELQAELAKCRGKLEICKKDFNRAIKTQSRNIVEGKRLGADTSIQEQMLWDAAIGYMLVADAIYAMKTIATFDSISHAYELLGIAMDQIHERERLLPKLPKIGKNKERNIYGYLTSDRALKEKEELLDGFFETLKMSGDIEECLSNARRPDFAKSDRREQYVLDGANRPAVAGPADWSVLDQDTPAAAPIEFDEASLNAQMDIHVPRASTEEGKS